MKKKILYFVIISIALIIQLSVLPALIPYRPLPHMLLMLTIAWTVGIGFSQALPWIIFAGLFIDLASYEPIGTTVILLVLMSYFVSFFSKRFLVEGKRWELLVILFFIIAATFFHRFYLIFVSYVKGELQYSSNLGLFFSSIPAEIIINGLLLAVLFWVFKKIENFPLPAVKKVNPS